MEYIVSFTTILAEFISLNNIADCFLQSNHKVKNKAYCFYSTFLLLIFAIFVFRTHNTLKLIAVIIIYAVFLQIIYKGAVVKKVSLAVISLVLNYGIDYIVAFFSIYILKISSKEVLASPIFFTFGSLTSKLVLLFLTYTIKKVSERNKEKSDISIVEWLQILTVPCCSLLTLFLLMDVALQSSTPSIWLIVDALAIILSNIVLFLIISKLEKDRKAEQECKILEQQIKIEMENITSLVETYSEQRKLTHDYNNHLTILQTLLSKEKLVDAESYLANLLGTKKSMPLEIDSGNTIVDALITQKYIISRTNNIDIQVAISDLSELSIKNEDLVVILANLIDNAIDAAKECTQKRIIKIKLIKDLEETVLSIQNTAKNSFITKEELGYTSKKDKINHGYGLKNVDTMIRKYDGYYSISNENGWFKVTIVFPK